MVNTRSRSGQRGQREIAPLSDAVQRECLPPDHSPQGTNTTQGPPEAGAPSDPYAPIGGNFQSGSPVPEEIADFITSQQLLHEETLLGQMELALTRIKDDLASQRVRLSVNERRLNEATSQLKLLRTDVNSILERVLTPRLTGNTDLTICRSLPRKRVEGR